MARIRIKFSETPRGRLSIRFYRLDVPYRIDQFSAKGLAVIADTMIEALGSSLMLYEMSARLMPVKDHHKINHDCPTDEKTLLHWRWRALVLVRAEQRRRARRATELSPEETEHA